MITFDELVNKHKFDRDAALSVLTMRLLEEDGVLLYQNKLVGSSHFGESFLVIAGPTRTVSDPDNPPEELDPHNTGGLPSMRVQFIGRVDLDSVRKAKEEPHE